MLAVVPAESSLPKLLFLRPSRLRLQRFFLKLGGTGEFSCAFNFGCVALYDGASEEDNEYASAGGDICDVDCEVDITGKELPDAFVKVSADDDNGGELDPEAGLDGEDVSGKGYSNRVELVANGVPIIWEEGEWSVNSVRSTSAGIFEIRLGLGSGDEDADADSTGWLGSSITVFRLTGAGMFSLGQARSSIFSTGESGWLTSFSTRGEVRCSVRDSG